MSSVPNTPAGSAPRGPTTSPLLNTPFGSQRPSSAVGRSELGSRSMRSQAQSEHDGLFEGSAGVAGSEAPEGERTIIWGTSVNVQDALRDMLAFFNEYRPAGSPVGSAPYYHACLEELHAKMELSLNLDCGQLKSFDASLYTRLVNYPVEMIPICDEAAQHVANALFPGAQDWSAGLKTRTFNLAQDNRLRDLDPMDIDKLISVRGMVTRCSPVIPDLKAGFFACTTCGSSQTAAVDRGAIAEPQLCTNRECQAGRSMCLLHNRSWFVDKQLVRLQEAPEHVPEGETPQTVSMCTWDQLVDVAKPGDRVEVTGIFRAMPVRVNPRHRTFRSIYKTYVDMIHVRKLDKGRRLQLDSADGVDSTATAEHQVEFKDGNVLHEQAESRKRELLEISKRPNLYEQLAAALAPSVWELDDVKKGVLLQLFGASNKQLDAEAAAGNARKRGEMNVLLVGDPGTSKSQLLQYVHKVAPRGIYTSGKGSSAVGLTAYVTRDPETREFVLESGALVLSDRGVCCIDEFDKMSDGARSILHEAMEQQTVSVAKAGIICSLNARTSVLASANPICSKYDPKRSVVDNINLAPTLLSRFDLIYLILDKPNERADAQLARHLVSLYQLDRELTAAGISQRTLMDYITLARQEVHPVISEEAATDLISAYVAMRRMGGSKRIITATPRQLESLIRLSEAHARMRLSAEVEPADVAEAVRLMKVATQSAATDPTTGTIDMDLITTGRSAASRTMTQQLAALLREKFAQMRSQSLPVADVHRALQQDSGLTVSTTELREALGELQRENVIRLPRAAVVTVL